MLALGLTAATFLSTLCGGLFAIRFRERSHLILGFMAGFLLGVVGFDILPHVIAEIGARHFDAGQAMTALVAAFLFFHVMEKMIVIHHAHESDYAEHKHPAVGILWALALIGHSLMDGLSIGLGFQVARSVGLIVAMAVISHDFTDGMNTASVMLSNQNGMRRTIGYLLLDAVAPLVGLGATMVFSFPAHFLFLYLCTFAGFLLYIGASDILPQAHSPKSSAWTIVMTIAGALLANLLSRFV